jgi:AP-3 complex subunit beta
VKLQTINLAAKLFALSPDAKVLGLLHQLVLSLARYDVNYDVRDRARMMGSLLIGIRPNADPAEERGRVILRREQVRLVLFEGKATAHDVVRRIGKC